jgi:CheY-like chemotaxis protein
VTECSAKLLVVDDSEISREFLARRLERRGFETETAECGPKALEVIEKGEINLVLLDVQMPDMSGLEVLRRIREIHPSDHLPVIMVTGSDEDEDVTEALRLGANAYILKNVDLQSIVTRIQSLLSMVIPSGSGVSDTANRNH